ncbi:MAG: phage tail tape measure protein [Treponema sp.]|jgi:TP901 family phage tail tape measure protein|nr:phage tail tape measure protein [Treponema sp.]
MNFVSSITLAFNDAFSSGFNKMQSSLAEMRGALDDVNKNQSMKSLAEAMEMMTSMADPMRKALSGAMNESSHIAGSMVSSFRNIQISLGATNKEMAVTRRELFAIGGRAAAGPEAVAGAFADVASGVADASKRMAIMNAAVLLAEANQADLAMSTNSMVRVMNAWNLSADNAALAADVLTQTSIMGIGSFDEFAGSIGQISTLAASAGIGLDELGASFAYVTNKCMSAEQAQKQMKGIISTLVSPSETLSKLYEFMGIESGQAMIEQYGLAESLSILKDVIGDEQAFSSIIGSAEAATVALALTEDAYAGFATSFRDGMLGVTKAAQGVELESIEMKMDRLNAASSSLQAQIGQDINGIKGFFIDMKFGFLSNVVSPIMTSPVGSAVSKVAAFSGMAAKGILDIGSGALNAAAQMTTLATNISDAGGISKIFETSVGMLGGSFKILTSPLRGVGDGLAAFSSSVKSVGFLNTFKAGLAGIGKGFAGLGKGIVGALPKMGVWIASMWAAAAAHVAAFWPVYAVIAGVAALATGVYLLIKNWDKVSEFFVGLWEEIKSAFAAAWDWIKSVWNAIPGFFSNLWDKVTGLFTAAWDWIKNMFLNYTPHGLIIKHWDTISAWFISLWEKVKTGFFAAWDWIKNLLFGASDWVLAAVAVFLPIIGIPALIIKHWDSIKTFFVNLWNDPKATILGFIDWIGGKVADLVAPFKVVGDVVGGVFSKVGGFFKGVIGGGKESGAALNDAFASGIQSNAAAPGAAFGSSLQTVSRQMPHSDAPEGPLSGLTASGRALTDTFASGMDESVLREKASVVFSAAMPTGETVELSAGGDGSPKSAGSQTIHIQNLYMQADECQSIFDFVRMIMHSVNQPMEVPA